MYQKTKKIIQEKYQAGVFPGVALAFLEGGEEEVLVFGEAANLPKKERLTEAHLFDVASLTKVICTTSVILQLIEEGRVSVDIPLQTYLPQFKDEKMTIRHLLTHTGDIVTSIDKRDQLNAKELKQAYLTLQSGENLGEKVQYTDAGTIILGFLIESVFDKPVIEVFQSEVLRPLKMTQSGFPPFGPEVPLVSTEKLASGEVLRGVTHDPKARVLGVHAGNAGLFTTIRDVIKFVQSYFQPQKEFLSRERIQELLKDHTPNQQGNRSLGWDLKGPSSSPFLFHTGYTGTFIIFNPITQQALIFLSNRVHPFDYREAYKKHRDEIIETYLAEIQDENML